MLLAESLSLLVPAVVAAYLCLLGPGQAWWRGRGSSYPRSLARIAASALWTTVLGLTLAAWGSFSLPRVVLVNGAVTLVGYLLVGRVRDEGAPAAERAPLLPVLLAACLWAYWPPFETFIGASDAVTYTAGGIHLARHGALGKHDDLGPLLDDAGRRRLFTSVLDHPLKPPFMRMRGGVVLEAKLDDVAYPSFFPAPVVWSALAADALGPRWAGAYAGLFAALAVGACWAFARRLLSPTAALAAAVLIAANAAAYWSARMPLSEPLAWFFLWVGLGALDAWDEDGVVGDARLAGAMLGAVGLVRIEYAMFVLCLLAARRVTASSTGVRPLMPGFHLWLAALMLLTVAQAAVLYGAYTAPLVDAARNVRVLARHAFDSAPALSVAGVLTTGVLLRAGVRRFGLVDGAAAGFLAVFVFSYAFVLSEPRFGQTFAWLRGYAGLPAVAAAVYGAVVVRRRVGGGRMLLVASVALGGLVLYDPHVLPTLPWGARRLVPLVLPAVFILAAIGLSRLGRRRPALALGAWVLVGVFALAPARPLWGRDFYHGAYARLAELDAMLPRDAIVLIDASLGYHLLGVGLWYSFDRNSLPVDLSSEYGRRIVAGIASQLAGRGPLYLLKLGSAADARIPFVAQLPYREVSFDLLLPEVTYRRPPTEAELFPTIVAARELRLRVRRRPPMTGHHERRVPPPHEPATAAPPVGHR